MNSQSNKSNDEEAKKERSTKSVPGFFSRLMFFWIVPIFYNGYRRDLDEFDLVPPQKMYNSQSAGDKLERRWWEEEEAAKAEGRNPSFVRALVKAFGWYFVPGGLLQFMIVVFRTTGPLLFSQLLTYWSKDSSMTRETAIYYSVGMIACNILGAACFHHGLLHCQQVGMLVRVATSSLMFRKLMRMDIGALGNAKAGKVVNILSNDLQRFDQCFMYLHSVWIMPIQIAFILYVSYRQAGIAAVIGFVVLLATSVPFQAFLAHLVGKARNLVTQKTDARVKLTNEVISGIQVIKMYGWEIPFEKLVQEKREDELSAIRRSTIYKNLIQGFAMFNERFAIFITILSYIFLGNNLSANVIYPIQQLMISMRINLTVFLPFLLFYLAELMVTIKRIEEFMSLKEKSELVKKTKYPKYLSNVKSLKIKEESTIQSISYKVAKSYINYDFQSDEKPERRFKDNENAVELQNVSASWTGDPNALALKNISISLPTNKLSAIIGPVGAGKSSFLELILKELSLCRGTLAVSGEVSYACQDAWLLTSTVRENITFGLPFEEYKYKKVCKACALEKDFQQFPFGDQTLVGERGVLMSGGQRARINLARAVYREADIYLLDDPLSAVDANVGRQLFDGCINGYLRGRTRILVTHQVHFLKAADFIVVLNEGSVAASGTYSDILSSGKSVARMLSSSHEDKHKVEDVGATESKEKQTRLRTTSNSENVELPQFETQNMEAEKRASGNLRWKVIREYFTSGSHWSFAIFTISMIIATSANIAGCDYWVSYWTNQMAKYGNQFKNESNEVIGMDVIIGNYTTIQYIIIHGCIVGMGILLSNVRVIPFVKMCTATSNKLHKRMFATMLRGSMRFFDANSSGRILNRFVKDVGAVDDIIPIALMDLTQILGNILMVLILNAIALYWTMIPTLVLVIIAFIFARIYLRGAQGLKRLESTCKSPVFDMVTSTLNGISTVRACGAEERLIEQFDKHQDVHTAAWNGTLNGNIGFGVYLDMTCIIYLVVILLTFLFGNLGDTVALGDIAMALTQATMMLTILQYGVRMVVEFIAQLTSVERMLEYTQIQTEDNLSEGDIPTPPSWPSQGKIEFENASLRYSATAAPVLKNLNIKIESGTKIGIVGRTGAGKSSMISAIFRFADIEGNILIDDIHTSLVAKQALRSKISIIPQEPVLFSATIRYNLDPFDTYSDDEIWKALEQVDMKSAVVSLDYKVTEGGSNFSVGQRQLMCLARAVLRSNKILIMDEATANVDPQTDNFIQQTIRRQFATCTVLTIAHRLNTIMDSDRVLVMDKGQIVEYDHPYILLSNPDSKFSSMVHETGDKSYEHLFNIAKNAYFLTIRK